MPRWMPDWRAMMAEAPELRVPEGPGYVYLVADSHLGDARAPAPEFLRMLDRLAEPRLVVMLGDLFKVWLAHPKYWDHQVRAVIGGFAALRGEGVPTVFVVGNRDYLLPRRSPRAPAAPEGALPFEAVIHGACTLRWGARRYGFTHGDVVNRGDTRYLRWRALSRSAAFEAPFRAMPGPAARWIAQRLESALAGTNRDLKISYPTDELERFAADVLGDLDGFFLGHFHRDTLLTAPGRRGFLRLVPDWFSRRQIVRLAPDGTQETLAVPGGP